MSKIREIGLSYCEKCFSLEEQPHMYAGKNLYGDKRKKKPKSVTLYRIPCLKYISTKDGIYIKNTLTILWFVDMYSHTDTMH